MILPSKKLMQVVGKLSAVHEWAALRKDSKEDGLDH